jgi:hypothetical protein
VFPLQVQSAWRLLMAGENHADLERSLE